jgi:ABC-type Zn uptake system ZnuABC Zn-binding protein ZnuA
MKTIALITFAAAALTAPLGTSTPPPARLSVVATTPDLAALAKEIGGDAVDVKALAKPTEDPHFVDAKPSHIVTLNRADVLIEGGAELELGWLPPLLESARNSRISAGAPGRVVASKGIKMLEVPTTFDRSKGDVHALGNPHFLIDPLNAKIVAADIAEHLSQVQPQSCRRVQGEPAAVQHRDRCQAGGMGEAAQPVPRREDRDVPQGLRVLRRAIRPRDRRDAGAQARHRAVALASRAGDQHDAE